jgi:hypothetical protein
MVALVFGVANLVLPDARTATSADLGHDFLAFYTAGAFVRDGRADALYDLSQVAAFQRAVAAEHGLALGGSVAPWWNPPHAALLFVPLSLLPFPLAVAAWTLLTLACLAIAIALLARMLPAPPADPGVDGDDDALAPTRAPWQTWGLIPLLILTSMPFVQVISHGQNTFVSLLLLAAVVSFWRGGHAVAGGFAVALLAYKPQLAAVAALVMLATLGWRVLLGLSLGGLATVSLTLHTLPGTLADYLHRLPMNLHLLQVEHVYPWDRHVTLTAFWRLLVQGDAAGAASMPVTVLVAATTSALLVGLLVAIVRQARVRGADTPWAPETQAIRRDRLIAATIAATPLLMPFYFDYDLLLLAIPATLLARERLLSDAIDRRGRLATALFVALVGWTAINPILAGVSGVNGSVVLLVCLVIVLIRRATPDATTTATPELPARLAAPLLAATIRRAA